MDGPNPIGTTAALILAGLLIILLGMALFELGHTRRPGPSLAFRIRARLTDWIWRLIRPR